MADFLPVTNPKRSSNHILFIILGALLLSSFNAFASDFQSPRTAALGGAGHASPMLNDAIYLNPSFASYLPSYSISGNYGFYGGPSNCDGCGASDPHGHLLNFSIQDGRSDLFQAGVALTELNDRKILNIGASRSVIKQLGVGLGGKWALPQIDSPPLLWDTMASVTFLPIDWIQLAAIVDNIFERQDNLAYGMYREYILGTKANVMGVVLLYFDPHLAPHAPDSFGHELGIEFPMMSDFFFRLGNFRHANVAAISMRASGYSIGLGWVAPSSSFDFAIQRVLDPVLCNIYSFSMTAFF